MALVWNYLKYRIGQLITFIVQEREHFRSLLLRNDHILSSSALVKPYRVNVHYWRRGDGGDNLGDDLSPIICDYLCGRFGVDNNRELSSTKHLYAIGSILGFGCQNATVWGSGLLEPYRLYKRNIKSTKMDIRAVRGPLTRDYLVSLGVPCPEVYGDPAILLPELYMPVSLEKRYKVSVIAHYTESTKLPGHIHTISIATDDYRFFVDEVVASELIVSSSLHGIILAEAYGVQAILWNKNGLIPFKVKDYYYSTNRFNIPVVRTLGDIDGIQPVELPELSNIQKNLLESFPKDLWAG